MNPSREAYLQALIDSGAVKIAPNKDHLFELRNGQKSWLFADHGELICYRDFNPAYVTAMIHYLDTNFPDTALILANVDSKSSPQTTGAIAFANNYDQIGVIPTVTMNAEKGTNQRVRTPLKHILPTSNIVVIDDVLTPDDTTALDVISQIREVLKENIYLHYHLLVGLIRNPETAGKNLRAQKVAVHGLLTSEDVLAKVWPTVNEIQKAGLLSEFPSFQPG